MHRLKVSLLCLLSITLAGSVFGQTAPQPDTSGTAVYDSSFSGVSSYNSYSGGATYGGTAGAYFNARYFSGNGVGYRQGYSQFGGFVPFWMSDDVVIGPDMRLLLANTGGVGANLGGIGRKYFDGADRILGAAAYFDIDNSSNRNTYTQGTFGLETLGQYWDLRGNVYYTGNTQDKFVGNGSALCVSGNPYFAGNNIVFQGQQGQYREQAMGGVDLEVGAPIFQSTPWLRGYVGAYYYKANQVAPPASVTIPNQTSANPVGFRGHLDAWVADDLLIGVNVTTDPVWGTNVNGMVDFRFSGFKPTRYFPQWTTRERMLAPWQRNWRIAVEEYQTATNTDVVAINPNTGLPYFVAFVNGDNTTAGTGTFEDPYKSFDHPGGIAGADIIYVAKDGSTSANPYIGTMKLLDNQILLGEGGTMTPLALSASYGACSVNGNYTLPGVDGSGNYPWVSSPGGHAIGLANNNEVSGFHIINSVDGILGNNITDANLRNLDIHNNTGRGINLTNVGGNVSFLDVNSSNNGTGIFLSETGKTLTSTFTSVTTNNNVGNGLQVVGTGGNVTLSATDPTKPFTASGNGTDNANVNMTGGTFLGNFTGATFNNSVAGSGFAYNQAGGTGTLNLTTSTLNGNFLDGLNLAASGGSSITANVTNSQLNSNKRDGIHSVATGGSTITTNDDSSNINQNLRDGYFYDLSGNSVLNATFLNDSLVSNKRSAFYGLMDNSTATFNINNTLATGSTVNGFALDATNGSIFNATATTVDFSNSGANGMNFALHGGSTANFSGTGITSNSNVQNGVTFLADGTSIFGLTAASSSFNGNGTNGLVGTVTNASTANLDISGSTINGNTQNGAFVTTTGLSNVVATFANTNINNNQNANGIYLNLDNSLGSSLSLTGTTTLNNNGTNGLRIDASTGTVISPTLIGTTIQGNKADGILLNAASGASIGNVGNATMLTNVTIQNNVGNGVEANATGASSLIDLIASNTLITDTLAQQKIGFQFDALTGGQVVALFNNGSALNNNVQNAVNGTVSGAGSIATITLDGTNASNSGNTNAVLGADTGGVLNFNASNGASFSNSVNGAGLLVNATGINSVANIELDGVTANGNKTVGFGATATDAVAPGVGQTGATLNVCLQSSSFSNNTLQGLAINVGGPGAVAYYGVGTTTAGTGVTVKGNGQQGLLTQTTAGGELDYRSVNSTYNNNGTGATKYDGVDMRVDGTGSKLRTLFSSGTANGNGRDGLHFGGLTDGGSTNGADITVSLSNGTTASGNGRYSLNFDANGANTANLVEDPVTPPILVGPINLDFSNVGTAVVNLTGVYHFDNNLTSNGLAVNFANTNTAFFSLDGQGTSTADNNLLDGISVDMTNVTNGSIFIGGFSSISGNGGNGIHVGMTNVTNGALGLQGIATGSGTAMTGNGGNGIDVQLNSVNLVNNFSSSVVSPNVIGLTLTDNQSYNACLPLPVVLPVNSGVIVPATGLTIDHFNVATSGAGGIIVDGTAAKIATGGAITNNTVSGSQGGDGIQLSLHNAALVNPTADGFVLTGNSSTGNTGNGINIDLLNATMNNLNMSGTTTVNGNTADGLHINLVNSSMTPTSDIDALLASGNGGNGVSISAATNSNIFIDIVSLTANTNTGSGFAGSALSGSTLNVCLDAGSVSTNGAQGLNLNVDGAGSIANLNLGPVATLSGPGVSVNGNTDQGLLATVTNAGVLNYRSINSTYNNNGNGATKFDGVDMRVSGAGSTIDTLFYGGSANGNGRDGYHFGGLTDGGSTAGATLTVSLSGVTSTGNTRDALNFDALNAANANLLMDPANPSTIVGNSNVNVNGASNEVVLKLSGLSFAQGFSQTFDHAATGINNAYVSLDGLGTSTISNGATTDAFSVTMKGLVNGSVLLDNYASITNTSAGRDAIAVTMDGSTSVAGFMNGAVEIKGPAGLTAVSTNGGNGVDVKLTNTNLVNGLGGPSSPIPPIVGLTTTSNLASPLNCLPLPTTISLNGLVPATGLTISNLSVTGTAGVNGIVVTGTNSTIAATGGAGTGGIISNNTIGSAFTGDGINVSMTNTGTTAAMINGFSVTGNTVSGTIGGDGIRVQDLNTGAAGSAADNITIGSNKVTGVTGNGIEFVVTDPTASVSTANNLQIINNTVKTSGGNALAVSLKSTTTDVFTTSGNSLDTSTLSGFALNLDNARIDSWLSTGGDITGNTQNGLVVTNSNISSILSGTFTNSAVNNNGADGVKFTTSDATKSIFGDKVNSKNITFTGGSISNNGASTSGSGVNLTTVANGSVANLVFTNETIGNTAIGGTQQNGLNYNIAATGGTVDATFTGGSINNNAVDAINGTVNGTGALNGSESTIILNGVAANGSGSTGALFTVNNFGALTVNVQDNAGTGSTINNSGADGIKITATGTGTVANATVKNSSVSNNGRTAAGNGLTLNLDNNATSLLTVDTATIGNTAVGGTQDEGVLLNLNQTLVGANTNLVANFKNSTISNNSLNALHAEIIGASATNNTTPALTGAQIQALAGAHISLDKVTAAGSGTNGMLLNVNGGANPALGGVLELTSTNGTAITGSGTNGILLNAHDATTLVSMSLQNTSVTGNGTAVAGDGLQANITAGARFNLEASSAGSPMSFSNNTGNGINVQTSGVNSRSDLDLFTATVNSNTLNGLTFLANNGGAVNLRAYDTTFDLNKLAGMTGTVTQTAGTGTSGIVNIIGGEANNNGTTVLGSAAQSGYSLTATNTTGNAAILTGQFQPDKTNTAVSATGNKGYGINFVASGAGTQGNLLMSGNTTLSGNTLGALNVNLSNMDQAIVKVSGIFDNNTSGDGIDVSLSGITQLGVVAITGGEVKNNAGHGINVNLNNVVNGGVLIGGLTDVSGNGTANGAGGLGQDGIHVVMNNVGTGVGGNVGALTIDGQSGAPGNVMNVSNNTGNGVSVAITGTSVIDNSTFNMAASSANVIDYNPAVALGTTPNPIVAAPLPNPLLNVGLQPVAGTTFSNSTEIHGLTMNNNGNSTGAIKTGNGILFGVDGPAARVNGQIVVSNNSITNTGSTSTTSTHAGVDLNLTNGASVVGMDLLANTITGTKGDGFQLIDPWFNNTPPSGTPTLTLNMTGNVIDSNTINGVNINVPNTNLLSPIVNLNLTNNDVSSNGSNGVLFELAGLVNNANVTTVGTVNVLSSLTANTLNGNTMNTFNNNGLMGMYLTSTDPNQQNTSQLNLTVGGAGSQNQFNSNGNAGLGVNLSGKSSVNTFNVSNAIFNSNKQTASSTANFNGDGLAVYVQGTTNPAVAATFNNAVIGGATNNTTFSGNQGAGFHLSTLLTGSSNNLLIQNSTFNANVSDGITIDRNAAVQAPGPYVTNVSINNNTITGSTTGNGIGLYSQFADGPDSYFITKNTITGNALDGIKIFTTADADINVTIGQDKLGVAGGNTISSNGRDGISANQNLGLNDIGRVTALVVNNTIKLNTGNGIGFGDTTTVQHTLTVGTPDLGVTKASNIIDSNGLSGIFIDGNSFGQSGSGNTAANTFTTDTIMFNSIQGNGTRLVALNDNGITVKTRGFERINIHDNVNTVTIAGAIGNVAGINFNGGDGIQLDASSGNMIAAIGQYNYTTSTITRSNDILHNGNDGVGFLNANGNVSNVKIEGNNIQFSGFNSRFNLAGSDSQGRGINVLNAANSGSGGSPGSVSDTRTSLSIAANTVTNSQLEGVYIVNTSVGGTLGASNGVQQGLAALAPTQMVTGSTWFNDPRIAMNIVNNVITSNGQAANGNLYDTTGLVVRIGSAGSNNDFRDPGLTATNLTSAQIATLGGTNSLGFGNLQAAGGVANVTGNIFGGNFANDVTFSAFTSTVAPPTTVGTWYYQGNAAAGSQYFAFGTTVSGLANQPAGTAITYVSDPLARLDLNFTGNKGDGNNLYATRTDTYSSSNPAYYNNNEQVFKSRIDNNPSGNGDTATGPYQSGTRGRSATTLPGFVNLPSGNGNITDVNNVGNQFLYPSEGGSTFHNFGADVLNNFGIVSQGFFAPNLTPSTPGSNSTSFGWDGF